MHFYIKGEKIELGVNTLQDLIDMGISFTDDDEDFDLVLEPNQYTWFCMKLSDEGYNTATVYIFNGTDGDLAARDCTLKTISYSIDDPQDILSFGFPLDMTAEELFANAGEPDDIYNYVSDADPSYYSDTYSYTQESEHYYANCEFEFEFVKDELNRIEITYMP